MTTKKGFYPLTIPRNIINIIIVRLTERKNELEVIKEKNSNQVLELNDINIFMKRLVNNEKHYKRDEIALAFKLLTRNSEVEKKFKDILAEYLLPDKNG